jgi:hypothetical protein
MGGSSFDPLLEELQQLQHVMQELERTNQELRLQLANLRMGKGIILDIAGKRFVLSPDAIIAPPSNEAQPIPQTSATATTFPSTRKTNMLPLLAPSVEEQATQATITTPQISGPQVPAVIAPPSNIADEEDASFLEEIMYDEFANQMTNPISVWTGPAKKPLNPEEEKKATLRRELMGSFLLE